jgi:hypothetical protein
MNIAEEENKLDDLNSGNQINILKPNTHHKDCTNSNLVI